MLQLLQEVSKPAYPSTTPEPCLIYYIPSCDWQRPVLWRGLRYLRYFQQEVQPRFANWFFEKRAFDRRGSAIAS